MKIKKFLLPLIVTPLLAVSCNKGGSAKVQDWEKDIKEGMTEDFGVVVPYVKNLKDPYISYEEGSLFVYAGFDDYDSGLEYIQSYDETLKNVGFVGEFEEIVEEDEGETYYSIYGSYEHSTNFTFAAFDESFAMPVSLQINFGESYAGYALILSAELDIEYHESDNPFLKVVNVLDEDVSFYFTEGESYLYRYLPGYEEDEYYCDIVIQNARCSEAEFHDDLVEQHCYIQDGGWLDNFDYWVLPWEEDYELYINQEVIKESGSDLYLTYGRYDKAVIYDSFPLTNLLEEIGFNYDSSSIPTFASDNEYGFKMWSNSDGEFTFIDAIDPKAGDESIEKDLSTLFLESLTAKGYQPVTAEDDDEEILYYQLNLEGCGLIKVGYEENDYYFIGFYSFTPSNNA